MWGGKIERFGEPFQLFILRSSFPLPFYCAKIPTSNEVAYLYRFRYDSRKHFSWRINEKKKKVLILDLQQLLYQEWPLSVFNIQTCFQLLVIKKASQSQGTS